MFETILPVTSESVEETLDVGARLGQQLEPGTVVALHGDLGSGKTHLVKGIASFFGIATSAVSSPTFSIINSYDGELSILHFDLYRISTGRELVELGLEEYLSGDALSIIEWPDIASQLLPQNTIHVCLDHVSENARHIAVCSADTAAE